MDFGGIANLPRQAPKENDIPQGMQNLIDALKATSQPVTPSGAPTVAGQLEQALNQRANPQPMGGAPMGAPQMGADMGNPQMQPMGPGVPQAAQMAAIAGQQQMAQQQAAGQQPPQLPLRDGRGEWHARSHVRPRSDLYQLQAPFCLPRLRRLPGAF